MQPSSPLAVERLPAARPEPGEYAGLDEYVPEKIKKRRTVRDQKQALVRWRAGWTAHRPGSPFWEEVHSVINRARDGRTLVRWKDSWEIESDAEAAFAAAKAGRVFYATTAGSDDASSSSSRSPPRTNGPGPLPPPSPAAKAAKAPRTPPPPPAAKPPKAPRKRKQPPARVKAPPPSEALSYAFDYEEPPSSGGEESGEAEPPGASRRRVAKPETWLRNLKKTRIEPLVSEKPPCGCAMRCYQRIGRDKRKTVRATFQAMERKQKKAYMRALIVLNKVKSKAAAVQMGRQRRLRSFTAEYHLKVGGRRYRVCLKAFQAILGVGSKQIKLLNSYAWAHPQGDLVPVDQRGKHTNRPNRVPPEVVQQIDAHIISFPRESSHYALATTKTFLDAGLSVRKMHNLYLELHEPRAYAALAGEDEGAENEGAEMGEAGGVEGAVKPYVKYDFYNEAFRKFDLAFGKPEVDSCATCDELKLQISAADDEDIVHELREKRRAHLLEADRGYRMRRHDQDLAQASRQADPTWVCPAADYRSWDGTEYVCSDMAGVLQTPKVPTNKAFYLRKLKTYAYGLFSGQANRHSLLFWDEQVSNKGANEVLSASNEFFMKRRTGATHLAWWADNTSSQLKNQFMMLFCNESVRDDGLAYYNRLDNKYSPPGHTFMENDRAFGALSRAANKTKVIGSSKSWVRLAAKVKQPAPYHTAWLERSKFRDWKKYLGAKYVRPSVWKNTAGEKVPFLKVITLILFNYFSCENIIALCCNRCAGSTTDARKRPRTARWWPIQIRCGTGCRWTRASRGRRLRSCASPMLRWRGWSRTLPTTCTTLPCPWRLRR
jgi:hypothetical protein